MSRAAIVAVVLAGCATAPSPVQFGPAPTMRAADYDDAHARWTRRALVHSGVDTAIDAYVTLFSDEFRAAYLARVTEMRRLTPVEQSKLAAAEDQRAKSFVDVYITATTSRWQWNDLVSPRSLWTLTLVDDQGHSAGRPTVVSASAKEDELATLFGPVGPFTRVYRVSFDRGALPIGPSTRWVELHIAGALGDATLRWDSR